ncbi:N-acetylmuramate alpha-1-phosphate uridylyltransferase MurU [Alkalimarinus coralli]|uniref:N-acetylmuramate alpha-1-phosphate uridylyltransferase MurU n=1 Tax=Alkalimarinus coralli TaxID=2935863 RepID=UPI00202B925F|nr:nucleotidyltransferase family protein [Alkalimarinus coralli]
MKAMILAAGLGTRMRPLTNHTPKPLLKAAGKPLLQYHIEGLTSSAVDSLVINTSWLGAQISEFINIHPLYKDNVQVIHEDEPLETAGGIINALPLLVSESESFFIVVNGDVWTDFDYQELSDIASRLPDSVMGHLVMVDNPPQHPDGDFYLHPNGLLTDEAPNDGDPAEKLTFSGISLLNKALFQGCAPGKRPLAPLLRKAMAHRQISGHKTDCTWMDIGTPERLAQLNQHILSGSSAS